MTRTILTAIAIAGLTASVVFAGGHSASPEEKAVKARNAHMQLYSFNLGLLGGMAKGEIDYSAELAGALASDLNMLAKVTQAAYWPEGTSNADMEGTRALPAGWSDPEMAMKFYGQLGEATEALVAAAGTLEGLQSAMGPVGKACGDCHKATRAPRN